jgi:hypothetical protein
MAELRPEAKAWIKIQKPADFQGLSRAGNMLTN